MATKKTTRKALKTAVVKRKRTKRAVARRRSTIAKNGGGIRSSKKARVASTAKSAGKRRRNSPKKARTAATVNSAGKRSRIAKKAGARAAKKNSRRVVMKWKKFSRRRQNGATGAKAMFEKFHGKPSTKGIDYKQAQHYHAHLAELGKLDYLKVIMPEDFHMEAVELRPKGVIVAASEDGGQIYFVGGDQKLDLSKLGLASQLPKDHVVVGPVFEIQYRTEKKFDDFKPLNYFHAFGEEGGELPTLCYDVRSGLMYLVGGSYQCEAPGIVD